MAEIIKSGKMNILKWTARITGLISCIFFISFMIGEGFPDLINQQDGQLITVMSLLGVVVIGYIFAWFREKEGGIILIFISVIIGLYLLYLSENNVLAAIIYCLPFLIPGILFLFYSYKKNKK